MSVAAKTSPGASWWKEQAVLEHLQRAPGWVARSEMGWASRNTLDALVASGQVRMRRQGSRSRDEYTVHAGGAAPAPAPVEAPARGSPDGPTRLPARPTRYRPTRYRPTQAELRRERQAEAAAAQGADHLERMRAAVEQAGRDRQWTMRQLAEAAGCRTPGARSCLEMLMEDGLLVHVGVNPMRWARPWRSP